MNDVGSHVWSNSDWEAIDPHDVGLSTKALNEAVAYHRYEEADADRDLAKGLNSVLGNTEQAKWAEVLGPTRPRGDPNGLVMRHGKLAMEWGDTDRVDMTFSATKSYLAVVAGVAIEKGLIQSIDEPLRDYALDDGFEAEQNRNITWRQILQQASEWEGTLWDKPDVVDRNREVGPGSNNSKKGTHRDLKEPGTFYEYNDVRVNRLALSLMQVFRKPLPEVLKDEIMDPIGASSTWEWHGYKNSYVVIDGKKMQSVPGGGHWGGGLFISSRDHARFGSLILNRGYWNGRQIISEDWIEEICHPSPCNPNYGFMWWLNTGRKLFPYAPESSFFALGAGQNLVWLDRELDLVAVFRWIKQKSTNGLIGKVMAALS